MSYTAIDWLRDTSRENGAFDRGAMDELVKWMHEDQRAIVRTAEHDALILHVRSEMHDHDLCEMAEIHWDKDAKDWERE